MRMNPNIEKLKDDSFKRPIYQILLNDLKKSVGEETYEIIKTYVGTYRDGGWHIFIKIPLHRRICFNTSSSYSCFFNKFCCTSNFGEALVLSEGIFYKLLKFLRMV